MSTLATWLLVAVGVLFVAALVLVAVAGLSVHRRGRELAGETGMLLDQFEQSVRSLATKHTGPTP